MEYWKVKAWLKRASRATSRDVPVKVIAGLSNGKQTEITGGDLKAGMAVITDVEEVKK